MTALSYSKGIESILTAGLCIAILLIGTGLYKADAMPKDEILVSILSAILLIAGYGYSKNYQFIEPKVLLGFLIFNCFFILRISYSFPENIEFKTYFTHVISIGAFLAIYSASNKLFSSQRASLIIKNETLISLISLLALATLLYSQLWQVYTDTINLSSRPGGFLNPNTTAALALIFMFTIVKLSQFKLGYITLLALLFATSIILLAQSRSSILALMPLLFYIFYIKRNMKYFTIIILLLAILIALTGLTEILELLRSTLTRFKGDYSSNHRLLLLQQGWSAFLDAPILGNGYRFIANYFSFSTHNEILETLTNFGIVGLLIIASAFYFLYIPFSIMFCIVCILPTLLFTHNFFDTYAFQAALGLALAADRHYSNQTSN